MVKRKKASDPQLVWVPVKGPYGHDVYLDGYDLEGPVDEAIAKLSTIKTNYPDKVLRLEWDRRNYDESYSFYVEEQRLETPEEVEKRLGVAAKQRQAQEERERREFDRLRAKFGQ